MPSIIVLVLACLVLTRAALSQAPQILVLKNIGIVGIGGVFDETGRDIVIAGGRISAIRSASAKAPEEARLIDCTGKWAVPGLIDMQVNLAFARTDTHELRQNLTELFAAGITSVLDIGGNGTFGNHGTAEFGPRVFLGGPPLRGAEVEWDPIEAGSLAKIVQDSKQAREAVRQAKQAGARLIFLDANLEPGEVKAVLREAQSIDLPAGGRLILTSTSDAVKAGLTILFDIRSLLSDFVDGDQRKSLTKLWSESPVVVYGPRGSKFIFEGWQEIEVPKDIRRNLAALTERAVFLTPGLALELGRLQQYSMSGDAAKVAQVQEKLSAILRLAFDQHVPLLAGSGFAAYENWRPTLHDEIDAWVQAGIETRFALEAATINAGHALRQSGKLGQIESSLTADLLVLNEHPFTNPSTLRTPWLVIREGKVYTRDELLAKLDPHRLAERKIRSMLERQEVAWNDGDLERYMRGYWKSDSTVFASGGTVSRGWQATLERFRHNYGTAERMGQLTFEIHAIDFLTNEWAKVLGNWKIDRKDENLHGLFTLVCREINGDWKIIHDHTSISPAETNASKR